MQSILIQAYTLLILASSLLTQLANTPNASLELRETAQNTAQIAISYAEGIITNSTQTSSILAQTAPTNDSVKPSCTLNGKILNIAKDNSGASIGVNLQFSWDSSVDKGKLTGDYFSSDLSVATGTIKFSAPYISTYNYKAQFVDGSECETSITTNM